MPVLPHALEAATCSRANPCCMSSAEGSCTLGRPVCLSALWPVSEQRQTLCRHAGGALLAALVSGKAASHFEEQPLEAILAEVLNPKTALFFLAWHLRA